MKRKIIMDAAILFAITLIAGLMLGAVNEMTKEPIRVNQEIIAYEAYKEVFPDADSYEKSDALDALTAVVNEQHTDGTYGKTTIHDVLAAEDGTGEISGYVVNVSNYNAYKGQIKLAVGISLEGIVTGVAILESQETAGLGALASEEAFRSQYTEKQVNTFTVVKNGTQGAEEIQAISGATITSRAVTNAVNAALDFVREAIDGGRDSQ